MGAPSDLTRPITDPQVRTQLETALQSWLSTFRGPAASLFSQTLEVLAVEELSILELTLRSLSETRSLLSERRVTPYRGEAIPPKAVTDPLQVNLKGYTCDAPQGFEERRTQVAVPESFRLSRCLECHGKQRSVCEWCEGSRWQRCPTCEGKGQGPCVACQGTGRQTCLACQGKRTIPSQGTVMACPACQGHGGTPCPRCVEGKRECSQCRGVGRVACGRCFGQGTIACRVCEGQGQLLHAFEFNVLWRPSVEVELIFPEGLSRWFLTTYDVPSEAPSLMWEGQQLGSTDIARLADRPEFLRDAVARLHARVQESLAVMPGTTTIRQQLTLARRPLYRVSYRTANKDYQALCWGPKWEVVAQDTPVGDAVRDELARARAALDRGEITAGLAHVELVRRLEPHHPQLHRFLELIHRRLAWRSAGWGSLGGVGVGVLTVCMVLVLGRHGIHWGWPIMGAAFSALGLGFATGWWLPSLRRRWGGYLEPVSWKWTVGVSAGAVLLSHVVICGALRWNPVRWMDEQRYRRLIHQHFPYGLPTVPWASDLQFLDAAIRRYEPAGVNVRTEKLILAALTKRAHQVEAERQRMLHRTAHPPKRTVTLRLPAARRTRRR
ncbi:MAG: hypothetical protein HYZ73_02510 [Elusimicrobia bacterium]|nr:hypothetical protein [Elusimicrobiota bacterium]